MWPYWLMFLLPAIASLSGSVKPQLPSRKMTAGWGVTGVVLALLIGWRQQVGGDWGNYAAHYADAISTPLEALLTKGDPGYWLLLGWAAHEGISYQTANLFFGIIFTIGLVAFCRQQPRPWLALTVAVPYLVIVLGMGYTRQGVALGLIMLGLVALGRGVLWKFVLCAALAATFHKSAVVLVPLAILATPRGRLWTFIWVGIAALGLYWSLLESSSEQLYASYVESEMESQGARIRVAMNVLPALLLLRYRKRFAWSSDTERNLWQILAWLSLASAILLITTSASTAVDRMALYLIPLQLFVFTRVPDALSHIQGRAAWIQAIIIYYALVLFIWLVFATHAPYWLPYRFYPIALLFG